MARLEQDILENLNFLKKGNNTTAGNFNEQLMYVNSVKINQ